MTPRPLVLVAPGKGGARIVSLNRAAQRGGLAQGELLSNARSKVLDLQSRDADPAADAAALRRLALWCLRYTPVVAPWDEASGADGLFLDITGCAHLFGGEERSCWPISRTRLRAFGLVSAPGGCRYGRRRLGRRAPWRTDRSDRRPGRGSAALQALPLAALRLSADDAARSCAGSACARIGEVMRPAARAVCRTLPAGAPAPARPGAGARARAARPRRRRRPSIARRPCSLEPILSQEHVLEAARACWRRWPRTWRAMPSAPACLAAAAVPVVSDTLPHDGDVCRWTWGSPRRAVTPEHIAQLIGLRLYRLGSELEADFGFEAAAVHVLAAEAWPSARTRSA